MRRSVGERSGCVHDELERAGWRVDVAAAVRVKGLAPLACKTDKIDVKVLERLCDWSIQPLSARAQADIMLTERIAAIHARSRQTYGAPPRKTLGYSNALSERRGEELRGVGSARPAALASAGLLQPRPTHSRSLRALAMRSRQRRTDSFE